MHRAFGEALGFAGRAPKMADNDDPVRINHHWLPPSVRFDRGAHFGDGMGGPLACVSRVVFRAVNGPHLDVHWLSCQAAARRSSIRNGTTSAFGALRAPATN